MIFSAKLKNRFDKILYLYHKFFYKKQNEKISDTMIIYQEQKKPYVLNITEPLGHSEILN